MSKQEEQFEGTQNIREEAQEGAELSDEDLEQTAGGTAPGWDPDPSDDESPW